MMDAITRPTDTRTGLPSSQDEGSQRRTQTATAERETKTFKAAAGNARAPQDDPRSVPWRS